MGFEAEQAQRDKSFDGYQLNDALYAHAAPGALVMHCMPMVRGKEISDSMAEHPNSVLFRQSENRLHVQKALLLALMTK
jgi:ornithine carbamoyltransferase